MIKTNPIPLGALTQAAEFVYGPRVQQLLARPFGVDVLKKRLGRKSKDKSKGEFFYYIDLRDVACRLDAVVGPANWELGELDVRDCGDRVSVVSRLRVGNVWRCGESEAQKIGKDWSGNEKAQELVVQAAGPNATKRAAVLHGVGAYLYGFKDVNTWEPINDYGKPTAGDSVEASQLPPWAVPISAPMLVSREIAYMFGLDESTLESGMDDAAKSLVASKLAEYWGISSFKGMTVNDGFRLAGCIARINDYLDAHPGATIDDVAKGLPSAAAPERLAA